MKGMLYRLSRFACPPGDRQWVDALFIEADSIRSPRQRAVWLLGAAGLLFDSYLTRLAASVSRLNLALLLATGLFTVLALLEYEGLAIEDDWYGPFAILLGACFFAASLRRLRRLSRSSRL